MQDMRRAQDGRIDGEEIEPVSKVIETVAQAKGVDPLDLAPLADELDTDALNNLMTLSDGVVEVSFAYEGYTVTVRSTGRVALEK